MGGDIYAWAQADSISVGSAHSLHSRLRWDCTQCEFEPTTNHIKHFWTPKSQNESRDRRKYQYHIENADTKPFGISISIF